MRITSAEKERTRATLLKAAESLFLQEGYAATTTRAIARRAGVATGTLFNYFATKEALVAALLEADFEQAWREVANQRPEPRSATEALFALIATELRHLGSRRSWLPQAIEVGWTVTRTSSDPSFQALRALHLEQAIAALCRLGRRPPSELALHLYWTLYLGVLAFWSGDKSEKQAATLALLDRSVHLFCRSLDEDDHAENCDASDHTLDP